MKYTRSELREKIMIILYQIDFYRRGKMEYNIDDVIKENLDIDNEFVKDIVYGVIEKEKELVDLIEIHLKDWNFKRLGYTDQAILKLSTYELLYTDTPKVVSINEGIELAKKYSDEKVVPMINAVLDSILNEENNGL
jgi:N utilization substance protein B